MIRLVHVVYVLVLCETFLFEKILIFEYSGPHIAAVTMAAYECQSTDFPGRD